MYQKPGGCGIFENNQMRLGVNESLGGSKVAWWEGEPQRIQQQAVYGGRRENCQTG